MIVIRKAMPEALTPCVSLKRRVFVFHGIRFSKSPKPQEYTALSRTPVRASPQTCRYAIGVKKSGSVGRNASETLVEPRFGGGFL